MTGLLQVLKHGEHEVTGELHGLPVGQWELKLVRGGCGEESELFRGLVRLQNQEEGEPVSVRVVKQEDNEGQVFDSSEELSLVVEGCVPLESGANCDVGDRVACSEIVWDEGLGMEIIIIIIVAIIIFLLIVICIPVICCCCRKR